MTWYLFNNVEVSPVLQVHSGRHHNIQHNDTQHNDIQHNDTQDKELIWHTQHRLCIEWHYAEWHYGYRILSSIVRTFIMENDAEIFHAHYTWKVVEKGYKMASMMNKLAMNYSCEIVLQK